MYSKNAFTLIELVVWVTISMLLMTSVWILVSSGMQNILKQQNILSQNSELTETITDFYNGFNNISTKDWYVFSSHSWVIFKIDQNIKKGWFWYLWISQQTWNYCPLDSDFKDLNYLTWKTFIPYEEIWEDIFLDFWETENQTIQNWSTTFTVNTLEHQVLENDRIIIWWDLFWHEIQNNDSWLLTRLNNPTGIVLAEWWLFLSDTLNNRILFYKDWNINLILDKNDGIKEPTWLAYDDIKNILYIANSWKWEILSLSSEKINTNPGLDISFTPHIDINDISRISVNFKNFIWNISEHNLWDITFENINNWDWYIQTQWNTIEYYFTDYRNKISTIQNSYIANCNPSDSYSLNHNTPERHIITCTHTNTGTHEVHSWNLLQNFDTREKYWLNIQNISPYFQTANNYLASIELYEDENLIYQDTFKYFTQWDSIVNNLQNNSLSQVITWLWYPTGLSIENQNLKINDFTQRLEYSYDLNDINNYSHRDLNQFSSANINKIPYNKQNDILLGNPLSDIKIDYHEIEKYLSSQIKYFQYINCYNSDETVEKTFILQKNIN